jgi:hypothetical protein
VHPKTGRRVGGGGSGGGGGAPRSSGGGLGSIFTVVNGARALGAGLLAIIPYVQQIQDYIDEAMYGDDIVASPSTGSTPATSGRVVPSPGSPARSNGSSNARQNQPNSLGSYSVEVLYNQNGGLIWVVQWE